MKSICTLILILLVGAAYGQSNLPACQGSDVSSWSNCSGEETQSDHHQYMGEFLNGRRHGYGLYFSAAEGLYYETTFKFDELVESSAVQGFAAKDSKEKVEKMISTLLGNNTKVLKEDSEAYKKMMEKMEVPEKGLEIK